MDDITQRVIRAIAANQRIPAENITAESTFAQLNIDSLDALQLLFALEEEFGVDIPDDLARGFSSVDLAAAGIRTLLEKKTAAAEGA
jgi:acyl carrier protein